MSLRPVPWEGAEPAAPVSLDEAKEYARVTHSQEDALIQTLLDGALEWAELTTRRSIRMRRWDLVRDEFPDPHLDVLRPPIYAIESVEYRNDASAWVTIDHEVDLVVDLAAEPATIRPLWEQGWPIASSEPGSLKVRFQAGYRPHDAAAEAPYGDAPIIPAGIKVAVFAHVAFFYANNREGANNRLIEVSVPSRIEAMLWAHRVDL